MMLLLATLWMTAACGRDNGAANDSNENANSSAGMEEAGEAGTGNAGIPCISVSWGFRDRELLESLGAKMLLDTVAELRDCLLDMAAK